MSLRKQAGDTLVEVAMAMAVLSIVLSSTAGLGTSAMRIEQQSRQRIQATSLMQAESEYLTNLRDGFIQGTDNWSGFLTGIGYSAPTDCPIATSTTLPASSAVTSGLIPASYIDSSQTNKLSASPDARWPGGYGTAFTQIQATHGKFDSWLNICNPYSALGTSVIRITIQIRWLATNGDKAQASQSIDLADIGGIDLPASAYPTSLFAVSPSGLTVAAVLSPTSPIYAFSGALVSAGGSPVTAFSVVDTGITDPSYLTNKCNSASLGCSITFPTSPTHTYSLLATATTIAGSTTYPLTVTVTYTPPPTISSFSIRGSQSAHLNGYLYDYGQQTPAGAQELPRAYYTTSGATSCTINGIPVPVPNGSSISINNFNIPAGPGSNGAPLIQNTPYTSTLTCINAGVSSSLSYTSNVYTCEPQQVAGWARAPFGDWAYSDAFGVYFRACGMP